MGDKARDIGGDLIPYLTENGYPSTASPSRDTGYRYRDAGKTASGGYGLPLRSGQALSTASTVTGPISRSIPAPWPGSSRILLRGYCIEGNVSIGRNCRIERGVVIENSHIGHTSLIDRDVR